MFIFPLLYGIVSAEMFVFSKSVWMSTGFHWLWNYSITSVFMKNGNLDLIYIWIIVEMIILIPLLYCAFYNYFVGVCRCIFNFILTSKMLNKKSKF